MKNSETLSREIGCLGEIVWDFTNPNRAVCKVSLREALVGVDKFVFIFLKSKSKLYHPPIKRKDSLGVETKTVEVVTAISSLELSFSRACIKVVRSRIENQISGHNTRMNAFGLFSTVRDIFPSFVGRPKLSSVFGRHDLIVPVKSMRSSGGEEVLVHIRVRSSKHAQMRHIKMFPKVPSVVVSNSDWLGLVHPAKELLISYVNKGESMHL